MKRNIFLSIYLSTIIFTQPKMIADFERLIDSFKSKDLNAIKEVVKEAGPGYKDDDGNSSLHISVIFKNLQMVKELLKKKYNSNAKNKKGETPLMLAVKVIDLPIVEALLASKANPNIADNDGNNSLYVAVASGNIPIFEALLKAKADVNAKNKKGESPKDIAQKIYKTFKNLLSLCKKVIDPLYPHSLVVKSYNKKIDKKLIGEYPWLFYFQIRGFKNGLGPEAMITSKMEHKFEWRYLDSDLKDLRKKLYYTENVIGKTILRSNRLIIHPTVIAVDIMVGASKKIKAIIDTKKRRVEYAKLYKKFMESQIKAYKKMLDLMKKK